MACLTIWQGDVTIYHQAIGESERDCWYYNGKKLLFEKCYSCDSCNYVYFCGRECRLRSWTHHKAICTSIATLNGEHKKKTQESGLHSASTKREKKVAELIGDKCLIQCRLNQREVSLLMDTRAQVSIISEDYMQ